MQRRQTKKYRFCRVYFDSLFAFGKRITFKILSYKKVHPKDNFGWTFYFYLVVIWKALTQNCPKVRAIINVYSKIFNDIRYLLLEELLLWLRLKKATRLYALVGIPNQMELR